MYTDRASITPRPGTARSRWRRHVTLVHGRGRRRHRDRGRRAAPAAGHPVTLVTHTARDAERINAPGRARRLCRGDARPRAVAGEWSSALTTCSSRGQGPSDEDAARRVTGAPRAAMSLQNGIEKEQPLIDRFGPERVLPSVIQVTATLQEPGRTRCASIATSAISSLRRRRLGRSRPTSLRRSHRAA